MNQYNNPSDKTPQIVFLGLCERASYVREGNTNIFKWNILGLKTIVLSYIFPLKFDEWIAGFAFPGESAGIETKLRMVDETGNEVGTLSLFAQAVPPNTDNVQPEYDDPLLIVPEYGWTTAFLPLTETGWVIPRPGIYYLENISGEQAIRMGTLQFVVVEATPLSTERIAAIKADPYAAKAVRIELGCKYCPSKLHAYAALERSEESEKEGWIWYQDLPDFFKCECEKTKQDLQYVQKNLHGLLGRRRWSSDDQLSFMPLYERSSLESIRTNFAHLVSRNPREELLQQFLEQHPILLHQYPARRIIPKPPILTAYVADFGIITPQKELILVELEKTTTRLMKKNGGIAAPLSHAFDQVRDWLYEVDEHRLAVLDSLKIDRAEVSVIRGLVIAGRDTGYDARDLRKLKGADYGRVTFLTYDDLLFALDALIRRVEAI